MGNPTMMPSNIRRRTHDLVCPSFLRVDHALGSFGACNLGRLRMPRVTTTRKIEQSCGPVTLKPIAWLVIAVFAAKLGMTSLDVCAVVRL